MTVASHELLCISKTRLQLGPGARVLVLAKRLYIAVILFYPIVHVQIRCPPPGRAPLPFQGQLN